MPLLLPEHRSVPCRVSAFLVTRRTSLRRLFTTRRSQGHFHFTAHVAEPLWSFCITSLAFQWWQVLHGMSLARCRKIDCITCAPWPNALVALMSLSTFLLLASIAQRWNLHHWSLADAAESLSAKCSDVFLSAKCSDVFLSTKCSDVFLSAKCSDVFSEVLHIPTLAELLPPSCTGECSQTQFRTIIIIKKKEKKS